MSQRALLQTKAAIAPPGSANPPGRAEVVLSKPDAKPGELDRILATPKFNQWWDSVNRTEGLDYIIGSVDIRDANWFGPTNLGFFKADCKVYRLEPNAGDIPDFALDAKGQHATVPAIAFVRGGAVAILVKVTVHEPNKSYFILTSQIRFPVGQFCLETAAGMLDGSGDFKGVAAKEIEEELGIKINAEELHDLGRFFPSPGGCDEFIQMYYYETTISQAVFDKKQRSVFGSSSESEHIVLQFVPEKQMSSVLLKIGDAKAEIAYRRYLLAKRRARAASCGYSAKTARCGVKYAGTNPDYCTYNEDTARCRVVASKRKTKPAT